MSEEQKIKEEIMHYIDACEGDKEKIVNVLLFLAIKNNDSDIDKDGVDTYSCFGRLIFKLTRIFDKMDFYLKHKNNS
jgi:hypothetical protein